jgi:hypothetical protein
VVSLPKYQHQILGVQQVKEPMVVRAVLGTIPQQMTVPQVQPVVVAVVEEHRLARPAGVVQVALVYSQSLTLYLRLTSLLMSRLEVNP